MERKREGDDVDGRSAKRERAADPRIDVHIPEFEDGKYGALWELAPCVKRMLVMLVMCMNRWRADPERGMHCWSVELRIQIMTELLYGLCCYGLDVTRTIFRLGTYHRSPVWVHTLLGGEAALAATTGGSFVPTRWDIVTGYPHNWSYPLPTFPKGYRFATDIVYIRPPLVSFSGVRSAHPLSLTVSVFENMSSDRVTGIMHRTDRATGEKVPYLECYCVSRVHVPKYVRRARELGYEVRVIVIWTSQRLSFRSTFKPILEADEKEWATDLARILNAIPRIHDS